MTIYLHFDGEAVTRGQDGIARWEGEGPITLAQVREHFGPHCQLTIKPVIDLAGQVPVDAYEVGDHRREAVHLRTPCDIWPWADNRTRGQDIDHTEPYPEPRRGRATGPDRTAQPRPDDAVPPSDEDPYRVAGQTALLRHLHLANATRRLPPRGPHRHPPHLNAPSAIASDSQLLHD